MRPFAAVLVANRGEIAVRIIRTAKAMGLKTVAVFSDPDRGAPHVAMADEAHRIGPPLASESYLSIRAVIDAVVDPEDLRAEVARRLRAAEGRQRDFTMRRHGVPPV